MRKIIAHRGLLNGPDKNDENRPEIIENALIQNFDVEIDLWFIDGKWLLGHDNPQYEIQQSFFERDNFWIHCKNFDALNKLNNSNYYFNYFWHDKDAYTLTSHNYIWAYPGSTVKDRSIIVLPEKFMNLEDIKAYDFYGVCTDYSCYVGEILK